MLIFILIGQVYGEGFGKKNLHIKKFFRMGFKCADYQQHTRLGSLAQNGIFADLRRTDWARGLTALSCRSLSFMCARRAWRGRLRA